MFAWLESLGRYAHFAVRALLGLPSALARPREVVGQLYHILLGALPLGIVAGVALGVVIWLHLHRILDRFGAAQYLPQALALAVVLEFAPTGAGLIMAGRTGASLGAEIGSMRLTEQVDALQVLGLSPMRVLVGPRVLACMVAMPLLTMFIIYFGLAGSFAAEALGGGLSWMQYQNEWLRGLRLADAVPATAVRPAPTSGSKPMWTPSGIETPLSMIARRIFAFRPMLTREKITESSTSA